MKIPFFSFSALTRQCASCKTVVINVDVPMEINERGSSLRLMLAGLVLTAHTPARAPQAGGESQIELLLKIFLIRSLRFEYIC